MPVKKAIDSLKVGLIAYYPLDNNAADSSGFKNDGVSSNVTATTDRFGKANSAFSFDGSSSYIVVPDTKPLRLSNTDFTLNAWAKLASYTSPNILAKRLSPGPNTGWQWSITNSNTDTTGLLSYGPGGGSINAFGKTVVSLYQWHMMTGVYNHIDKSFVIYVDGLFDNETYGILPPNPDIATNLYIGMDDPSNTLSNGSFSGSMDDIRIYNRALNSKEVLALYVLPN